MKRIFGSLAIVASFGSAQGCHSSVDIGLAPGAHSSSMALSKDGRTLFVVNPEADSISVIDVGSRALAREIQLATSPPSADPATGAFTQSVEPRAVALSPDGATLYATGERSGMLYAIDVSSGKISRSVHVGSEPIGALVSNDGQSIFVAASNDDAVVRIDASSFSITSTLAVDDEPWALSSSPSGTRLLVTHFLGPGLTEIDPNAMTISSRWSIPDTPPRGDRRLAHGQVRGLYDAASRPGTNEVWTAHTLLGTDTAQPDLDFESTAFPSLSILDAEGTYQTTLSTDAQDIDGIDGSFADIVSGPHAIAFTPDGDFVVMVDANSGDLLGIDAQSRNEAVLLRPLPGKMPDGIAISADGQTLFVDERVSGDVAVVHVDRSKVSLALSVDGAPIRRLANDPMPAGLRLGQDLFNSADSSAYPITTNHWVACATCHLEGRSDAVTWKFAQGPRDTPSNAGGTNGTGFLFRTADRNSVRDYWHTINVEQGGHFDPDDPNLSALLDALTAYVNSAIPLPMPPSFDPKLAARGKDIFGSEGCADCHAGARFTDSGNGNPSLDLGGLITLHNVGTCVTGGDFPDVAHEVVNADPRNACAFDTPSLSGVSSSPPYLHDGSAKTLRDAVDAMTLKQGKPQLAKEDEDALVEYLRSL